jgi:hypothetical protein
MNLLYQRYVLHFVWFIIIVVDRVGHLNLAAEDQKRRFVTNLQKEIGLSSSSPNNPITDVTPHSENQKHHH